jgi:hypothetical protein
MLRAVQGATRIGTVQVDLNNREDEWMRQGMND